MAPNGGDARDERSLTLLERIVIYKCQIYYKYDWCVANGQPSAYTINSGSPCSATSTEPTRSTSRATPPSNATRRSRKRSSSIAATRLATSLRGTTFGFDCNRRRASCTRFRSLEHYSTRPFGSRVFDCAIASRLTREIVLYI